ncbi:hypothetical protein [Xenorhabdus bovienii]|uniref:hypothetical protein n=1 Tax=Xenorhabdus bovienii TaxID=40576 RepID=UPI0023B2EA6E|nr:hypothetical protein [Xenorhabdus bovienii]
MLTSIYSYKTNEFFNKYSTILNNDFLYYDVYSSEGNKTLYFKDYEDDSIELFAWNSVFEEYLPDSYWNNVCGNIDVSKEIEFFENSDYSDFKVITNMMFRVFDLNKKMGFYGKELTKYYLQYQIYHNKDNDDIRTFFLKRLFSEMYVGDYTYNKLSICNNELLFETNNGKKYDVHNLIGKFCDIIASQSLPSHVLDFLLNMKKMLHECIDFILGNGDLYYFNFDDSNVKYIDSSFFINVYEKNKDEIFNIISDSSSKTKLTSELFVSHMIAMNYSFFVLKDKPSEIIFLKSFLKDDEKMFINVLSFLINIGFYVWDDTFNGLGLDEYIDKIEIKECLITN